MTLNQQEVTRFYKIWCSLVWGVNEKHGIVPKFDLPVYGKSMRREPFIAIRNRLWENPEWIDDFTQDYEHGDLTEQDLGILADWRKNFVKGRFIIMKHLKKYSVFMTMEEPAVLYGVCGISHPIEEGIPYPLPTMVEAVLLPFDGKIIYDSFFAPYNISFGKGMRSNFKDSYDETKAKVGIIEDMNLPPEPVPAPKKKAVATKPPR